MTKPKSGKWHWLKWWPRRWRGDPAVQSCSLAARGAWRELLDVMQIEDTGGYLLIGGEVPDHDTVARLLGCTTKEWKTVEAELERRKVFSRRESDKAIYCRSRVREEETDGKPEGHPEGDPKGIPPETPGAPEGSPPSRALSSSSPLTSSSSRSEEGRGEETRPFPAHLDTPEVRDAWGEWERYRIERGDKAYTPLGFKRLLGRYTNPTAFVADIGRSIESNWQGIHPDKGGKSKANVMDWLDKPPKSEPRTVTVEGGRT